MGNVEYAVLITFSPSQYHPRSMHHTLSRIFRNEGIGKEKIQQFLPILTPMPVGMDDIHGIPER